MLDRDKWTEKHLPLLQGYGFEKPAQDRKLIADEPGQQTIGEGRVGRNMIMAVAF